LFLAQDPVGGKMRGFRFYARERVNKESPGREIDPSEEAVMAEVAAV